MEEIRTCLIQQHRQALSRWKDSVASCVIIFGSYNCGYVKTGLEKVRGVSLVPGNIIVAIFAAMPGHC
jgi:hypothetical protein